MNRYDEALAYEIFVKEEYGFAKNEIKKASLIWDVGGHVGLFSQRCLHINPQVKLRLFEPFPELVEKARERLDAFADQMEISPFGVAKEAGDYLFLYNSEKTMQSSQFSSFLNSRGEKRQVRCENLALQIRQQEQIIDVLKVDIEGMEFEVLLDLHDAERKKVKSLICEVHLFGEKEERDFQRLKQRLAEHFSQLEWQPSPYSPKIGLLWARASL